MISFFPFCDLLFSLALNSRMNTYLFIFLMSHDRHISIHYMSHTHTRFIGNFHFIPSRLFTINRRSFSPRCFFPIRAFHYTIKHRHTVCLFQYSPTYFPFSIYLSASVLFFLVFNIHIYTYKTKQEV